MHLLHLKHCILTHHARQSTIEKMFYSPISEIDSTIQIIICSIPLLVNDYLSYFKLDISYFQRMNSLFILFVFLITFFECMSNNIRSKIILISSCSLNLAIAILLICFWDLRNQFRFWDFVWIFYAGYIFFTLLFCIYFKRGTFVNHLRQMRFRWRKEKKI